MIKNLQHELISMGEEKYKEFTAKLIPTVEKNRVIGIRTPILRKFAKNLEGYEDFLLALPHKYYEENNLHAFLIEKETDFDECINKLESFLPFVDNWATCDGLKPKVLKKEPAKLLKHIKVWLKSKDVYTVRFAINLLMSYYLDEKFEQGYLKLVADVKSKEYYINMMRAWYFATALAKQYDSAVLYLENNSLDKWTHNKTIQKAVESFRITNEKKECLKSLRQI